MIRSCITYFHNWPWFRSKFPNKDVFLSFLCCVSVRPLKKLKWKIFLVPFIHPNFRNLCLLIYPNPCKRYLFWLELPHIGHHREHTPWVGRSSFSLHVVVLDCSTIMQVPRNLCHVYVTSSKHKESQENSRQDVAEGLLNFQ